MLTAQLYTCNIKDNSLPLSSEHSEALTALCQQPLHGVALKLNQVQPCFEVPYQLDLQCATAIPIPSGEPLWHLLDEGERYTTEMAIYKTDKTYVLRVNCEGRGQIALSQNTLQIDWEPTGTGPAHYLQTMALSLFLECQNVLCLHANTLVKNGQAHLFLAPSRTGKSTLTTVMRSQGYELTTDDMAALHSQHGCYEVYPSWAKVRLWPDSAAYLQQTVESEAAHVGKVHARFAKQEVTFTHSQLPSGTLDAMYYLNRDEHATEVTITPIAPSAGLIILMQNSMLGGAYRELGMEQQRVMALAALLCKVPLFKITYPSGLEHLQHVCQYVDQFIQERSSS